MLGPKKLTRRLSVKFEQSQLAPFFDADFYLLTNPDVRRLNIDPLIHFIEHGWKELRDPSPAFSIRQYLDAYRRQIPPNMNPLAHFIRHKNTEFQEKPSLLATAYRDMLSIADEFDPEYYLNTYKDVKEAAEDPLLHFAKIGWIEGRNPCPWFNTLFYIENNDDVASAKINPFAHFILHGRDERRMPVYPSATKLEVGTFTEQNLHVILERLSVYTIKYDHLSLISDKHLLLRVTYAILLRESGLFNDGFYRKSYLAAFPNISPLQHYIYIGSAAGLLPNPFFDPPSYLKSNPDVRRFGIDPCIHYAYFGFKEGRRLELFDSDAYVEHHPELRGALISPLQHMIASAEREQFDPTLARPIAQATKPAPAGESTPAVSLRSSGTILLVSHDLEVGGAQALLRAFARWLLATTKYDVRFAALRGGADAARFIEIAPVFDIAGHEKMHEAAATRKLLNEFIPSDLKLVLINSVASGPFLDWWNGRQPVISYIHELQRMIAEHGDSIRRLRERSTFVLGGSEAVTSVLRSDHHIEESKCKLVPDFMHDSDHRRLSASQREAIRRKYGTPDNAVLLVGCGVAHWRKAPDLFTDVAAKVCRATSRNVHFIWIGGGPDLETCEAKAAELGLSDVLKFIGFSTEAEEIIAASDVFLLPSLEDPFPLVCIHAALNGLPIVCFDDAGGIPAFVAEGAGVSTPFRDTDAMAAAAVRYIEHPDLRDEAGRQGRVIGKNHLVSRTGPRLLELIKQATGDPPHVSIVVPNYNHEKFLPERLESIYAQTFQDFEVILLDDASSDNSVDVLRSATERPSTRLVANDRNSGSPFAQWMAGIRMARGGLVWIAESDDSSDSEFLSALVPRFDDANVFLGFTLSTPIDDQGKRLGDYRPLYLDRINPGRWNQSYIATDQQEIEASLAIANSIPNASSVLFRKFEREEEGFEELLLSMKLCGDWLFYIRALKGGKVSYVADPLNYHRRHDATVTSRIEGQSLYFYEAARVRAYIHAAFRLSSATIQKAREFWKSDIERFVDKPGFDEKAALLCPPYGEGVATIRPGLLVITSDFGPGGGQLFAIRLANEWSRRGGRAFLASSEYVFEHPAVVRMIDPHVARFKVGQDKRALREIVRNFKIEIVQSSIWWADRAVFKALDGWDTRIPWVVTMHGCYETLLSHPEVDPDFAGIVEAMKPLVSEWVYTADKHIDVLRKLRLGERHPKIRNGAPSSKARALSRDDLGVRPFALLACLASRAIDSKGWREAVAAVKLLNQQGHAVDLLLIGEGPVRDELARSELPSYVKLIGQVSNLPDYIAASDVGLLPTSFIGESMPLVIIDFFAAGKPVVATAVGDIPEMIEGDMGIAGHLIPLSNGQVSPPDIAKGVLRFLDPKERLACGEAGLRKFETNYSIAKMCDAYESVYRTLQGQTAPWSEDGS